MIEDVARHVVRQQNLPQSLIPLPISRVTAEYSHIKALMQNEWVRDIVKLAITQIRAYKATKNRHRERGAIQGRQTNLWTFYEDYWQLQRFRLWLLDRHALRARDDGS